jgi:serine/threonine protein kinase
LGIHIKSGRKVAVKIMKKKDMSMQDLNLVKTEVEILKICQHPNIIRIYDVFENVDFIYISKFHLKFVIFIFSYGTLFGRGFI